MGPELPFPSPPWPTQGLPGPPLGPLVCEKGAKKGPTSPGSRRDGQITEVEHDPTPSAATLQLPVGVCGLRCWVHGGHPQRQCANLNLLTETIKGSSVSDPVRNHDLLDGYVAAERPVASPHYGDSPTVPNGRCRLSILQGPVGQTVNSAGNSGTDPLRHVVSPAHHRIRAQFTYERLVGLCPSELGTFGIANPGEPGTCIAVPNDWQMPGRPCHFG
jgi:hypothetical protein